MNGWNSIDQSPEILLCEIYHRVEKAAHIIDNIYITMCHFSIFSQYELFEMPLVYGSKR